MIKKNRSSFYPVRPLAGKSNFKQFNLIDQDGSITECVFLDIPDPSERERIICIHYLRHKDEDMVCFISCMPNLKFGLADQIKEVVSKKASKSHLGKEQTVVIVDNRTSALEMSDYISAAEKLSDYFDSIPFPEIWFYTGYCSDDDGQNAEFSFAPLKVTKLQQDILEGMAKSRSINADGQLIW